jgi:hypothetical protein
MIKAVNYIKEKMINDEWQKKRRFEDLKRIFSVGVL